MTCWRRLPIPVPPARHETVASYLARLASLHGLDPGELWHQVSTPAAGTRRRAVDPGRLAAITGRPAEHLARALPELRRPGPDWQAWRHQPQPGCPRCDARHDGGPVTRLLPHHRYVVHPAPVLDRPAGRRAARHPARPRARRHRPGATAPPAAAAPPRPRGHLRRGADRVPALRPPVDRPARRAGTGRGSGGPAAPRSSSRPAPNPASSAPPGSSPPPTPKPSASPASSPRPPGAASPPATPPSSSSSPPRSGSGSAGPATSPPAPATRSRTG